MTPQMAMSKRIIIKFPMSIHRYHSYPNSHTDVENLRKKFRHPGTLHKMTSFKFTEKFLHIYNKVLLKTALVCTKSNGSITKLSPSSNYSHSDNTWPWSTLFHKLTIEHCTNCPNRRSFPSQCSNEHGYLFRVSQTEYALPLTHTWMQSWGHNIKNIKFFLQAWQLSSIL